MNNNAIRIVFEFVLFLTFGIGQALAAPSERLALEFPAAHGSHPEFKTEWWYLTGTLWTPETTPWQETPRYGFQLTFFRRRVGESDQIFLAHSALSDFTAQKIYSDSRIAGATLGIAGADQSSLNIWNHGWRMEQFGEPLVISFAVGDGIEVRLVAPQLPTPLLHGEQGISRKGECSQCYSYYYSLPGINLTGEVRQRGIAEQLRGRGWFDHEFMNGAIESGRPGWDWISLLGRDGSEIMIFQVRGSASLPDYRSATLRKDGVVSTFRGAEITMTPQRYWRSSTGAQYPVAWQLKLPNLESIEVAARFDNQEVRHRLPASASTAASSEPSEQVYWEGAVSSVDERYLGYLEMTGYEAPIGGTL